MTDKSDSTYYSFRDGMPTGPDVSALQAKWPALQSGDVIPYPDIESIIGCPWKSARFKTVTDVWRKRLLEQGLVVDCDRGQSFRVLTADDIQANTYATFDQIGRKARKQRRHLAVIRPETDARKSSVLHQMKLLSATEREARKSKMNLLPGTAVSPAPRIAPPEREPKTA